MTHIIHLASNTRTRRRRSIAIDESFMFVIKHVSRAIMQSQATYLLLFSVLAAGCSTVGASEVAVPQEVSVMDLGADKFTSELSQSAYSGSHFLIEFYEYWCPHCQH